MERRLSAILAADMVGYSRLMEADEIGTLERQKVHRSELIDPVVGKFRGRIVKEMGDGILVEFPSVVDAVACAVEIQKAMPARETEIAREWRIQYRIGINLGDIVADDGDIYGDGVNVAARLEQLAEPGGICISGTVFDHLRSQVDVDYEALGEVRVKNIERAIRAYKVLIGGGKPGMTAAPAKAGPEILGVRVRGRRALAGLVAMLAVLIGGPALYYFMAGQTGLAPRATSQASPSARTSIAIVPFSNLGPANDEDYLAAGVREDLIAELSTVPDLLVITPASPDGNPSDTHAIARAALDQGITHVLTGSIRSGDGKVRINMRLIEAKSDASLWAKAFERGDREIVSLSKDIAREVVAAMPGNLALPESAGTDSGPHFPDPKAYDLLLQGNVRFARFTPSEIRAARTFYRKAAEIDPLYARAHALVAFSHALEVAFGWSPEPDRQLKDADAEIETALRLNPRTDQAYLARGLSLRSQRRYQEAIAAFEKAIELSPNSADGYAMVSLTYIFVSKPDKALAAMDEAMLRNPDHPFFYLYTKGMALFHLERFDEASELFANALKKNPDFIPARLALASAYAHLDRLDDARWEYQEVLVRLPNFTILEEQARVPYLNSNDLLRYVDGLKMAAGEV
ncbi:MAG: tetratricopeptide repeat protein [Nitratireductor sp.]|nr:tetratricopeptide repeat protein [Nitratireductor sp.]